MTAKELFRRYARVFNDDKELMYMTESQFVAALAEAIEGGHLQPVFCQPGEAGSKGGPQNAGDDIRVLQLKLRDADIVMKVIDDLIKGGALDARSIIGDARLNYGDPYDYKYLQG